MLIYVEGTKRCNAVMDQGETSLYRPHKPGSHGRRKLGVNWDYVVVVQSVPGVALALHIGKLFGSAWSRSECRTPTLRQWGAVTPSNLVEEYECALF